MEIKLNTDNYNEINIVPSKSEERKNYNQVISTALRGTNENFEHSFNQNPEIHKNSSKDIDIDFKIKNRLSINIRKRNPTFRLKLSKKQKNPIKYFIQVIDLAMCFFIIVNISLAITAGYIYLHEIKDNTNNIIKGKYIANDTTIIILYIELGLVICQEILLIARYLFKVEYWRQKKLASSKEGIFKLGLWKQLLLEMFILSIICPPYLDQTIKVSMNGGYYIYSYFLIINFFIVFKFYYFLRIFGEISIFTNKSIKKLAKLYKVNLSKSFFLKAQIKSNPYLYLFLTLILVALFFGFFIYTFEYGFFPNDQFNLLETKPQSYIINSFSDALWMIICTMLRIVYGDFIPKTYMGRCMAIISAIIGFVISSILIVNLSNSIELSPEQKEAHFSYIKMENSKTMNNTARMIVIQILKLNRIKQMNDKSRFTLFINKIFLIRILSHKFNKELKICGSRFKPSDQVLIELKKKLDQKVNVLKQHKTTIENIKTLTNSIIEEEKKILCGMENLKSKQNEIAEFLILCNQNQSEKLSDSDIIS